MSLGRNRLPRPCDHLHATSLEDISCPLELDFATVIVEQESSYDVGQPGAGAFAFLTGSPVMPALPVHRPHPLHAVRDNSHPTASSHPRARAQHSRQSCEHAEGWGVQAWTDGACGRLGMRALLRGVEGFKDGGTRGAHVGPWS